MSESKPLLFDDFYTGPRWRYGLQHRPLLRAGSTPEDFIVFSDRPSADPRCKKYGSVDFPRKLTACEVTNFELVEMGQVAP